jgi:hypothetical protein
MRLVAVLLLLLGCGSSSDPGPDSVPVDDGVPGPADEFVGVWQGSGSERSDSDVSGGRVIREIKGNVTISRLSSAEVQLDPSNFDGFDCGIVIYDVGADLRGKLRMNQKCWAVDMVLKEDLLALSGASFTYNQTTHSESATLKRAP